MALLFLWTLHERICGVWAAQDCLPLLIHTSSSSQLFGKCGERLLRTKGACTPDSWPFWTDM